MDKPIYVGFAVPELCKMRMHETYFDKLQPCFGHEIIQCHYIDTHAFDLSVKTKSIIKHLKTLEHFFDFSNLDENYGTFSNENKKEIGKFKIETI